MRKTHCKRGHERIPGNLNSNGACKMCVLGYHRTNYVPHPVKTKTHCPRGHARIPENVGKDGGCKICMGIRASAWAKAHPENVLASAKRWRCDNLEKAKAKSKECSLRWRQENPEKNKASWLFRNRMRYGLTPEQYDAKLAAQGNLCRLCDEPFDLSAKGTSPALDHNHKTGELRDFIHTKCNIALGGFKDDPKLCRLAAEYLERHKGETQ
jgi:hypothetical protein